MKNLALLLTVEGVVGGAVCGVDAQGVCFVDIGAGRSSCARFERGLPSPPAPLCLETYLHIPPSATGLLAYFHSHYHAVPAVPQEWWSEWLL